MIIEKLQKEDYLQVKQLWNKSHGGMFLYKKMTKKMFMNSFINSQKDYEIISYKALIDEKIVGFCSGVKLLNKKTFYLTMVLVNKKHRRQGLGKKLYLKLEENAKADEKIEKLEISFFNPVNLRWIIPFTEVHEHPNSPGVDLRGEGYLFFKNMGFRTYAFQNSYYRVINNYKYSKIIVERINALKAVGITVDYYNPNKHLGLKELMIDLNSEAWEKEILTHVKKQKDKNTLLVALENNLVVGFTGPLAVEGSGRGYFAGIGIHSQHRSKGIGTLLFTSLCMNFKLLGATYMTLFTGKDNPARNIYEKEGFRIVRSWANMRKAIGR